jgi:hypothetical protein
MNNQIPLGCALNVAIINEALSTNDLNRARIEIPLQYNIIPPEEGEPWPLVNMSWYAYMLYCLLVVPKEMYENIPSEDPIYRHYIQIRLMSNFDIKKEKKEFKSDPKYHFRSLRNSVSHLNYTLKSSNIFHMWDHPPGVSEKQNWHWEVSISLEKLHIFLGEIADSTLRIYNEVESGTRDNDGTLN